MNLFLSTDSRLHPGWQFIFCIPIFVFTEYLAGAAAFFFTPYQVHPLKFEMIYRPLHLLLLLASFSMMGSLLNKPLKSPLTAQGLGFSGPWMKDLFIGIAFGAGLVALAVLFISLRGEYRLAHLPGNHFGGALLVLWVLINGAMVEEVAFRGYPFQRLIEAVGPVAGVAILSLGFGAIHWGNPHATKLGALNTALVGVMFALAYLRTRMLWLPFGLHFAWNTAMGLVFGLPVSGITMFSVVGLGTANGPGWLTGGAYGIESSLTGTFVVLLGIAAIATMPPRPNRAHIYPDSRPY